MCTHACVQCAPVRTCMRAWLPAPACRLRACARVRVRLPGRAPCPALRACAAHLHGRQRCIAVQPEQVPQPLACRGQGGGRAQSASARVDGVRAHAGHAGHAWLLRAWHGSAWHVAGAPSPSSELTAACTACRKLGRDMRRAHEGYGAGDDAAGAAGAMLKRRWGMIRPKWGPRAEVISLMAGWNAAEPKHTHHQPHPPTHSHHHLACPPRPRPAARTTTTATPRSAGPRTRCTSTWICST